jgi:glutamine---fructose-6-phosphate transaminase (isomerizing)
MCGIIGFVGETNAPRVIIDGLKKLEYRGYDSAGLAIIKPNKLQIAKAKGRVADLETKVLDKKMTGDIGIGHTRWATHGQPSETNSHPHTNQAKTIAVVHNGIIENYQELKTQLTKKGVKFRSQTDTEVVAHLIDQYMTGDLLEAVAQAVRQLQGSFALGVVSSLAPNCLIGVRKESPLVVGVAGSQAMLASDVAPILSLGKQVYYLEDGDIVKIDDTGVAFFDFDLKTIQRQSTTITWDADAVTKGGFKHFTLKEIHEQPEALKKTISPRLDAKGQINLEIFDKIDPKTIQRIEIIGCGTAYHAGLYGKKLLENLASLPVEPLVASEYRYQKNFTDQHTLVIAVSQSGETADTLGALKKAKQAGAQTLAITNVVGSSITRLADAVLYTWAGPEVGVCSTKAYTTQLAIFGLLALDLARRRKQISADFYQSAIDNLANIGAKLTKILKNQTIYQPIAKAIKNQTSAFYIGRGMDAYLAMEGALKLKEISYIHTEAFPAGELKHGTIALITPKTPVIVVATEPTLFDKIKSNIEELKARGAQIILISKSAELAKLADFVIDIPAVDLIESALVSALPMQLLAYYTADALGQDVDKPRNLAKSVTVE